VNARNPWSLHSFRAIGKTRRVEDQKIDASIVASNALYRKEAVKISDGTCPSWRAHHSVSYLAKGHRFTIDVMLAARRLAVSLFFNAVLFYEERTPASVDDLPSKDVRRAIGNKGSKRGAPGIQYTSTVWVGTKNT